MENCFKVDPETLCFPGTDSQHLTNHSAGLPLASRQEMGSLVFGLELRRLPGTGDHSTGETGRNSIHEVMMW